jgi:metal-sulfur cluster biosynthetic enzyme
MAAPPAAAMTRRARGGSTAAPSPQPAMISDALARVRDPELDEPITELGFVVGIEISDEGDVAVALRLPTFFCAPNFAYLMVGDAQREVRRIPGVRTALVRLVDHFVDTEISAGVTEQTGFGRTFDGLADGDDLEELRATFTRKAYLARTHEVAQELRARGASTERLASASLADLPDGEARARFLARRAELGMPLDARSPFLLDVWGEPVPTATVADHLRRARTVHVSIEGNAGFCRGLLETRYAPGGTGSDEGRPHHPTDDTEHHDGRQTTR